MIKEKENLKDMVKVKPLRDFLIVQNKHRYDLKKGEEMAVHKSFLENLKTEKVIKE